jgi:hypothetical protein
MTNVVSEEVKNMPGIKNLGDEFWERDRPYLRKICSPADPTLLCGWGSFEHPEFQEDDAFQTQDIVQAFIISGGLTNAEYVYNVLFVRNAPGREERYFERVGVGRIFGPTFKKAHRSAVWRDIFLV